MHQVLFYFSLAGNCILGLLFFAACIVIKEQGVCIDAFYFKRELPKWDMETLAIPPNDRYDQDSL